MLRRSRACRILVCIIILSLPACATREESPGRDTDATDMPEDPQPPAYETAPPTPDPHSEETFLEIEALVDTLNDVIAARDFERWRSHLSAGYTETFSDPEVLRRMEQAPVLRTAGVRLRSLQDFFVHVVVPSRHDVHMSDLHVEHETQITALAEVQGRDVVLYRLIWEEEEWKVAPF